MKKITIEEFVKRVNALQAGEHISVQLIENGYIVTAFSTLVKGNRYHFMMVEGFYGNCEQGFEGFNEQGIYEYIDYVKMLADDTSELEEITELIVVGEKETEESKVYVFTWYTDDDGTVEETTEHFRNFSDALFRFKDVQDRILEDYDTYTEEEPTRVTRKEEHKDKYSYFRVAYNGVCCIEDKIYIEEFPLK